jgi:sulfatase maturation enzyme AslB (radical SAM superfamily)
MSNIETLQPLDNMYFSVEWETTLKCNLDCSYCGTGHDNSKPHPSLNESLKTIDFIFDYLELQMQNKPKYFQQHVNLNVFGGESLFHPNIIEILDYANEKRNAAPWQMHISTITNAVVGPKLWEKIVDKMDYFTVSFHVESLDKQKEQVKQNLLYLQSKEKRFHVSVMMHPKYWNECINIVEWCESNNISCAPRQIDHHWLDRRFIYDAEQTAFLTGKEPVSVTEKIGKILTSGIKLTPEGRACCSNQNMCANECQTVQYVQNKFKGWHCSVDKFFLYIKQTTGEVFTNKDCKMNHKGKVGPIGYLNDTQTIIDNLKKGTPDIICKKSACWCGICAPKAKTKTDYIRIMEKYER